MTKKKSSAALIKKLTYWRDYNGTGDEYRRTHDLDCVLTGGDLNADTIFSLWLPLRYSLNYFDTPAWKHWKDVEYTELRPSLNLKAHSAILNDMIEHTNDFLPPESELAQKLSTLFELGQERCNVMLLPQGKRSWNSRRGFGPYWDYFPHFLFDLFEYAVCEDALQVWLRDERLGPFFAGENISKRNILDIAGTGNVCRHRPKEIKLELLLDNYITILRRRKQLLAAWAS